MKKFALLIALALPVAFTSCSNDDDPVTIDPSEASINYGATTTIKASDKGGAWTSTNEFVASVADGTVTGAHVGEATIQYKKGESAAFCNITVLPTNNSYVSPCITFGATETAVKAYMNDLGDYTLVLNNNGVLGYVTTATNSFPLYVYTFDEGALYGSSISVEENDGENLMDWIKQYYAEVDETETGWIFADAYSILDANTAVDFEPNVETEAWQAIFLPVEHTKAGLDKIVAAHKAIAKKIAK